MRAVRGSVLPAPLVRYHPDARTAALTRRQIAERQAIDDTFAGLRFVRNRMGYKVGHDDFLEPAASPSGPADGQVAAWTWKHIPDPGLSELPWHAKEWEVTRYRAYQLQLAGRRIGGTISQAASFLRETAERSLGHAPATAWPARRGCAGSPGVVSRRSSTATRLRRRPVGGVQASVRRVQCVAFG